MPVACHIESYVIHARCLIIISQHPGVHAYRREMQSDEGKVFVYKPQHDPQKVVVAGLRASLLRVGSARALFFQEGVRSEAAAGRLRDRAGLVGVYNRAAGYAEWRNSYGWCRNDCALEEWAGVSIDGDGRLVGLSLENNNLVGEVGRRACGWNALRELNLAGNNQLNSLPPDVGQWSSLQKLSLSGTQVPALPPGVSVFRQLTDLDLRSTGLTALPAEASAWAALEHADFVDCALDELSGAVCAGWRSLKTLALNKNRLQRLPESVSAWTGLTELFCMRNRLESLPDGVSSWTSLETLALNDNQLTALPETLCWPSLSELHLRNNQLMALPDAVGSCSALQRVHLESNCLTQLPTEALVLWHAVRWVHLDNNPSLAALPDNLDKDCWPNIMAIYARRCPNLNRDSLPPVRTWL